MRVRLSETRFLTNLLVYVENSTGRTDGHFFLPDPEVAGPVTNHQGYNRPNSGHRSSIVPQFFHYSEVHWVKCSAARSHALYALPRLVRAIRVSPSVRRKNIVATSASQRKKERKKQFES